MGFSIRKSTEAPSGKQAIRSAQPVERIAAALTAAPAAPAPAPLPVTAPAAAPVAQGATWNPAFTSIVLPSGMDAASQAAADWVNANRGQAPTADSYWVPAALTDNSAYAEFGPVVTRPTGGFWNQPDKDGSGWLSQLSSGLADFAKSPIAPVIAAMVTGGLSGLGEAAGGAAGSLTGEGALASYGAQDAAYSALGAAGADAAASGAALSVPTSASWAQTLADSLGGSFLPTSGAATDAGLTVSGLSPELQQALAQIPDISGAAAAGASSAVPAVFNAAQDSQLANQALGITGQQAATAATVPAGVNLVGNGGIMTTAAPGLLASAGQFLSNNPTLANFLGNAGLAAGSGLLQSLFQPDAPPQLDYNALLKQQSQLSQQDALFNANLNRVDTTTPWGSQTWGKVADPTAPGGFRYTQNIALPADQQALLDKTTQGQLQQADLLKGAVDRAGSAISNPLDFSKQPSLVGSVSAPQLGMSTGLTNMERFNATPQTQLGEGGVASLQAQIAKALSGVGSPTQYNQSAADAAYNQASRYYGIQSKQDQQAMEARLAEQGFVPGTPAYDRAMGNFYNSKNLAMADMRDRATTQGFTVGSQQYNNALAGANQQISGATTGFNAGLSANNQNFNQGQTNQQLLLQALQQRNGAQQQDWSNVQQQLQANNQTAQNQFGMGIQAGQFQNNSRQQGISEALIQRQTPLNELSALRSGTQVQNPNFSTTAPQSSVQTPSVNGFAQTGYNSNLNAYNAATGQANQLYGSLTNLGSLLNNGSNSNWLTNLVNGLAKGF